MRDAYIYDAIRSPRGKGRSDGSLHEVTPVKLSADMLNAVIGRNGLKGDEVEDVIWGNATQVKEQGGCLARTAVLASNLSERVPGLSINRFCASGMEAVNLAANQVKGGAGEALSVMQAVKLKEIAAKAKGEKKPFRRRPKSYAED